jgi:hypothetical protein
MRDARSDLAVLVETEARLDRELAGARTKAEQIEQAARERVDAAAQALAAEIASAQARAATEIEQDTLAQLRAIDDEARREVQRFDAIRGERAEAIARQIADRLVALVHAEDAP